MEGDTKFLEACGRLYEPFFDRFPNDNLQCRVSIALKRLIDRKADLSGDPGGWAGGIAYAVGSLSAGVHGVLNADMEEAFGVSMDTIRRRAHQVRQLLGEDLPVDLEPLKEFLKQELAFTLRDEANAICAYAFRNGPLEDIHASGRITDPEMKNLMINASTHLAKLLAMKRDQPEEYDRFIRDYHRRYCGKWER